VLPLAAMTIAVLAGCTQGHPKAVSSIVPTPTASSSATSTGKAIPVYDPNGTAKQNLAYFDVVGHALLDDNPAANASGKTIVNWYVAHGFSKSAMQVTPDKTSIGLAAWNIEFSVDMNKTCLIGQAGNTGFQSTTAPLLATGKCLIGTTRPINW
jgi:hypothetical protein